MHRRANDFDAAWPLRQVKQQHEHGCGIASVAMLAGITYAAACHAIFGDAEGDATSLDDLCGALREHGLLVGRRAVPFWEQRHEQLRQHALLISDPDRHGGWHAMVWDGHRGRVLDPLDDAKPRRVVVGYVTVERRAASACSLRAPATAQNSRRGLIRIGASKQLAGADRKSLSNTIEKVDRRIDLAALKLAEVGTVDSGIGGKPVLRHTLQDPDAPDVPRDERSPIHGATASFQRVLKPLAIATQKPYLRRNQQPVRPRRRSILRRLGLVAVMLCVATASPRAQVNQDPTFNGTIARATCDVRNITACKAGSCEQLVSSCPGDRCGTISLLLKSREYSVDGPKQPLEITEISPAELGKPLWLKFQIKIKDVQASGRLTLRPEPMGGYATSAVVFIKAQNDPAQTSFSLLGMQCERVPDGP